MNQGSIAPRRRAGYVSILTGGAIVILGAAFIASLARTSPQSLDPIPEEDPAARAELLGMKRVEDTSAAASETDHVVLSAEGYQREVLSSIWVSEQGDVLEVYASGLTVLTEPSELGPNPEKYYDALVLEASRSSVFVTSVNGIPALAVEPNTDKLESNPGLVRFAHGDLSIVVSGKDMSTNYLLGVAGGLAVREVPASR